MSSRNGNGASVAERITIHSEPVEQAPVLTKTVAMVGTATSSRDLVNEQEEHVEVWGLNASYSWMPRWSRWFEVHDRDRYAHFEGDHLAWLQAQTCPIYMQKHYDDIPASVAYPYDFVQQGRFRSLFTSSVAYMLALAIAEGFEEIRLCGIDMALDSEYAFQRSACEYWIGIAEALGVKVVIPPSSPIGKAPVYGRDALELERSVADWQPRLQIDRLSKYETFLEELHGKIEDLRTNLAGVAGAEQLLQLMKKQDG